MTWLDNKLIITMGTGGVGKTTISASLAMRAAMSGKRVLVMTIDPSKRLKDALALNDLGGEPKEIVLVNAIGQLFACVLDAKLEFDRFVQKNLSSDDDKKNILHNSLYQRISTSLSGSQEFTAIEAVLSHVESGNYDMVILDTPPAANSVDFLRAPQKFYDLFNKDMMNWFAFTDSRSWFNRSLRSGTKKATQVLERLVGKDFLSEIYLFFQVIQVLAPIIQERSVAAQKLFADQNTAFALVSIYDEAKILEAVDLAKSLKRQGYHLRHVFMNKVFPFHDRLPASEALKKWQKAYAYQHQVKLSASQHFQGQLSIYEIKEQVGDIASLDALTKLSQAIEV